MKFFSNRGRELSLGLCTLLSVGCTPASGESSETTEGGSKIAKVRLLGDSASIRVETAIIHKSPVRMNFVRPGEAEASREVRIATAMGGIVEKLYVNDGDVVERGQRIAEVDRSVHSAQRSIARVEHEDAKRELDRISSMGVAVAAQRIDQAKTRLAHAKAQLRLSDIQRSRSLLEAPFAGVLAQVPVELGAYVSSGGTVARLLKLDPIVVSVSVSDRDVGTLKVGGKAIISTSGAPNLREGRISFVAPASDLKTRTFRVEVELSNEEKNIRPGMIASVQFVNEEGGEQLIIPQDFLVTRIEENGLFIVDADGVARWRPIKLGEVLRDQVVVLEGILDGDELVVVGHRALVDGDKLLIGRRATCCDEGRIIYSPDGTPSDRKTLGSQAPAEAAHQ